MEAMEQTIYTIKSLLKSISNTSALVQMTAFRRTGDKPMTAYFTKTYKRLVHMNSYSY